MIENKTYTLRLQLYNLKCENLKLHSSYRGLQKSIYGLYLLGSSVMFVLLFLLLLLLSLSLLFFVVIILVEKTLCNFAGIGFY
jgi:hypothetical protein